MNRKAPWVAAGLGKVSVKKPRRRLQAMSARMKERIAEYLAERSKYLKAHPWCAVFQSLIFADLDVEIVKFGVRKQSEEIHHVRGRLGPLLLDKRGWKPVSNGGHRWIDANRDLARQLGLLCERGLWGVPF